MLNLMNTKRLFPPMSSTPQQGLAPNFPLVRLDRIHSYSVPRESCLLVSRHFSLVGPSPTKKRFWLPSEATHFLSGKGALWNLPISMQTKAPRFDQINSSSTELSQTNTKQSEKVFSSPSSLFFDTICLVHVLFFWAFRPLFMFLSVCVCVCALCNFF